MKIKQTIYAKILTYILTTTILTTAATIGYISFNNRHKTITDAENIAVRTANENALKIERQLSENLTVLRTLAQAFTVYTDMEEAEWKNLFMKMYYKVYEKNTDLYKLWDSWEMKFFDPTWNKDYGRYTVSLYRQNGNILSNQSDRSMDGDSEGYMEVKTIAKDMLLEPYWDEFVEDSEEQKFMTTIGSPILINNKYAGIVAADIIMEKLQQMTNDIELKKGSTAYLVSNTGIFVSHPDITYIGQDVESYFTRINQKHNLGEIIQKGSSEAFNTTNQFGENLLFISSPIQVGEYVSPWSLILTIPYSTILDDANKAIYTSLIIGLLGIILISIIIVRITKKLSSDLKKTKHFMTKIGNGEIDSVNDLDIKRGDEIEDIATTLNELKVGLGHSSRFAEKMGSGILDSEFTPLSDNDVLGISLLNMRESLKKAKQEEENRKLEDEKHNWATQGLAKFGEILRSNSNNIKELAFSIMSNLVNYLEVNQGAIFIVEREEGEEPYLELKNAIAYGRDKFMQKRLDFGQSLVGRAAFEMKSIYMTEIPENYIQITSGMGTANPRELLVVPLILNDEVYGVIELASFKKIEQYHIDFVEKLGESIASTIATVKVNEKTTQLLERSKGQAEELAAQEEEMRQNLEELQATQEEAARREFEMSGIVNALGATAFTVEYDLDGTILSCNEKYAEMLGMSKENIVGQKHRDGYDESSEMGNNYDLFWADLCNGITKKQTNKVTINNHELWVEESYTPIKEPNETKPYKILKIGFDITEQKQRELAMQDQQVEIKKERMLLSEYKDQINQLKSELKQANDAITKLEKEPRAQEIKETPAPPQQAEIKASGDNLVDWSGELILGINEMDEQHEQLVSLANVLNASYQQGKNKKEIKENLRSLIDFASYHFGNEEHYFEEFGFEYAESHTNDHHELLKELKNVQTAYNSNKLKELDSMLEFIASWLINHFTNFDSKYVDLFKSKGL